MLLRKIPYCSSYGAHITFLQMLDLKKMEK